MRRSLTIAVLVLTWMIDFLNLVNLSLATCIFLSLIDFNILHAKKYLIYG